MGMMGFMGGKGSAGGDAAETTAFLARTTGLDSTHTDAYKALINGLVADGDFASFDAIYMFATQDSTTARLNLCSTSYTATNNGSTFTADAGYAGPYVDTTVDPSATTQFTQNSAHFSGWWKSASPSNSGGRHGFLDAGATKGAYITPGASAANAAANINNAFDNQVSSSGTGHQQKHIIGNRSASNARQIFINGVQSASDSQASTTIPTGLSFWINSRNFGGGTNQSTDAQCMMATIGASLSGTAAARVYARFHTYLQTIAGIA